MYDLVIGVVGCWERFALRGVWDLGGLVHMGIEEFTTLETARTIATPGKTGDSAVEHGDLE